MAIGRHFLAESLELVPLRTAILDVSATAPAQYMNRRSYAQCKPDRTKPSRRVEHRIDNEWCCTTLECTRDCAHATGKASDASTTLASDMEVRWRRGRRYRMCAATRMHKMSLRILRLRQTGQWRRQQSATASVSSGERSRPAAIKTPDDMSQAHRPVMADTQRNY